MILWMSIADPTVKGVAARGCQSDGNAHWTCDHSGHRHCFVLSDVKSPKTSSQNKVSPSSINKIRSSKSGLILNHCTLKMEIALYIECRWNEMYVRWRGTEWMFKSIIRRWNVSPVISHNEFLSQKSAIIKPVIHWFAKRCGVSKISEQLIEES